MSKSNSDYSIAITGRNFTITPAIRENIVSGLRRIKMGYPRIIDAKVICSVEKERQTVELILYCAGHITIEADTTSESLYAAIDMTLDKVKRQMRKRIARRLKARRTLRNRRVWRSLTRGLRPQPVECAI